MSQFRVYVTLKPDLLDPAGEAVGDSLRSLGYELVESVRIGKYIELSIKNGGAGEVEEMCRRILANPVTEDFKVEKAG